MAVKLSPVWNGEQFFDNDGEMLSGGKIFTYASESSSFKLPTWSEFSGTVENQNPIVLDSSGRIPVAIWLKVGTQYRLTLTKPDGTTVLQFVDWVVRQ